MADNPFISGAPTPSAPKPDAPKSQASELYVPRPADAASTKHSSLSPTSPKLLIPAFGRLYGAFAPFTELLMRLMAGGSLAFHGYQILFGNIDGAGRFFESVGFDNGLMWAWVVGLLEFVCGLLLAVGLLTRLAAGPIIVFLIVAIVTYHLENGYNWEGRGIEYPLFWAIVVFHFLVRGGGAWSLDRWIRREL